MLCRRQQFIRSPRVRLFELWLVHNGKFDSPFMTCSRANIYLFNVILIRMLMLDRTAPLWREHDFLN